MHIASQAQQCAGAAARARLALAHLTHVLTVCAPLAAWGSGRRTYPGEHLRQPPVGLQCPALQLSSLQLRQTLVLGQVWCNTDPGGHALQPAAVEQVAPGEEGQPAGASLLGSAPAGREAAPQ